MEQLELPFKYELKIGDKVQILSKNAGEPLPCFSWDVGDVGYVARTYRDHEEGNLFYLSKRKNEHHLMGCFLQKDLRRIR